MLQQKWKVLEFLYGKTAIIYPRIITWILFCYHTILFLLQQDVLDITLNGDSTISGDIHFWNLFCNSYSSNRFCTKFTETTRSALIGFWMCIQMFMFPILHGLSFPAVNFSKFWKHVKIIVEDTNNQILHFFIKVKIIQEESLENSPWFLEPLNQLLLL